MDSERHMRFYFLRHQVKLLRVITFTMLIVHRASSLQECFQNKKVLPLDLFHQLSEKSENSILMNRKNRVSIRNTLNENFK